MNVGEVLVRVNADILFSQREYNVNTNKKTPDSNFASSHHSKFERPDRMNGQSGWAPNFEWMATWTTGKGANGHQILGWTTTK